MISKKKELIIFVILVLVVSWLPMLMFNPIPENTIPAELLENPDALFPDVPGYSKVSISKNFSKYAPIFESDYVVAYTYTSESSQRPVWVLIQKASKPKSFHHPTAGYKAQDWEIVEENPDILGETTIEYLLAEKKGVKRAVIYWYFMIIEKKQRFLIYYLPQDLSDIAFVRVETPYDEEASNRLNEVGKVVHEHIDRKIEETTTENPPS